MPSIYPFFATSPLGIEDLLAHELTELGAQDCRATRLGVFFNAPLSIGMAACLHSRVANRVLLPLLRFACEDAQVLYERLYAFAWHEHLDARRQTFAIRAHVGPHMAPSLRHSHFISLKAKDAIVDALRDRVGMRPNVDLENPDLVFDIYLADNTAQVSLDLSGQSLHRRGYRSATGQAPLKENLAAAILLRSRWPQNALKSAHFVDPMCGSGTLVIEAACMAAQVAPGLLRSRFGFEAWPHVDIREWHDMRQQAIDARTQGLLHWQKHRPCLRGYDIDPHMIALSKNHAMRCGVETIVQFQQQDTLKARPKDVGAYGSLVVNPPYGERLASRAQMLPFYTQLGLYLKHYPGWNAHVLLGDPELGHHLGMRAHQKHRVLNGDLVCALLHFDVRAQPASPALPTKTSDPKPVHAAETTAPLASVDTALVNRLLKNHRRLKRWLQRDNIRCYRIYDADLPEYAVAIDIYHDRAHIQEYAPPVAIDSVKRQQRLRSVFAALASAMPELDPQHFYLKVRQKQRGTEQYRQQDTQHAFWQIEEADCRYWVNLSDYLDTGLFLDHRPMRQILRQHAENSDFLNLFGYTASASVAAAKGGARSTTTVDMSRTYLNWAEENFKLNGLDMTRHHFVQMDCLQYLENPSHHFDLIFVDPPTFSNSKRMQQIFDVQRDHVALLQAARRCLKPGGRLLFSTNAKRFVLDHKALQDAEHPHAPVDITRDTLPPDFARQPPIHQAWLIDGPPLQSRAGR